ncbi:hypothetical protein [Massilia sp. LjRoot122]|uniref:hypothetical protein n=1 Tax=Massilia sp. LjRoot122 TaxID=3342257 RepID=UPI003ECE9413
MNVLQQQAPVSLQDHFVAIVIVAGLVLAGLVWLYLGWRKYKKAGEAEKAARGSAGDNEEM